MYGTRVAVLAGDYLFAQSSWFLANLENIEVRGTRVIDGGRVQIKHPHILWRGQGGEMMMMKRRKGATSAALPSHGPSPWTSRTSPHTSHTSSHLR